jgi:thymidine kinase
MCIKVILGKNGTGKTAYLQKKIAEYQANDIKVVTNVVGFDTRKKLSKIKEESIDLSGYPARFGYYTENGLDRIADDYKELMQLIVADGDVLLLDEPESYLNILEMCDLCNCLNYVSEHWKAVYITGRKSGALDTLRSKEDTKLFICDKFNCIREIPVDDMMGEILNG